MRVAQLQDADGGERLRDRADAIGVLGRRSLTALDVGRPERRAPDHLAVAKDRGADRRHPLLRLRGREDPVEGVRELRQGAVRQAATPAPSARGASSIARSMSSSSRSRCVTARTTVGWIVEERPTPASRSAASASSRPSPSAPTSSCTKFVCTCSRSTGSPAACHPPRVAGRARGPRRAGRRGGRARTPRPPRRSPPDASRRRRGASRATRARSPRPSRRAAPRAGSRDPSRGRASPCRRGRRSARRGRRSRPRRSSAARRRGASRRPRSRAASVTASSSSTGQQRPPDELCVFSTARTVARWSADFVLGIVTASSCSTVKRPSRPSSASIMSPAWAAAPPYS